jgi:ribosomal protein S18 acetylase RimI-like enzyme
MSKNKETYREPLTDMVIDSTNLDKWKKRLSYVTRIPDNLLLNIDVKSLPKDVNQRKELYFEKIKLFIENKSVNLLQNLISINKSNNDINDRRDEYNEIMRKYNKSIKEYYDVHNKKIIIRQILNVNKDKLMAYLQYYNYKKGTKDTYTPKNIVNDVDDFILKNQIYGLYLDDLMMGFLIIKKTRKFNIDSNSSNSGNNKQNTFYIQEVYIDKSMRGRKLGKILLNYAVLLCPKNKKYISLMTYEGNVMANIAASIKFKLQKKESGCPVNKMLFVRKMKIDDFEKNTVRITQSKSY